MKPKERNSGSITVFLTFVLLIILSLIAACLENARVKVASAEMQRTFAGSMDAALTEYYRPLYDDYGVFFMDKGLDSESQEFARLEEQMTSYCQEGLSCEHTKNGLMGTSTEQGMNLLGADLQSIQVDSAIYATDYQGNLFYDQVLQYMKFAVVTGQLKGALKNFKVMEDCEATASVMEKETETDQAFVKANNQLLQLMETIEGVTCNRDGLVYEGENRLKVQTNFAKKICVESQTKSGVGIDNDAVFQSLQGNYYNPVTACNEVIASCDELIFEAQEQARKEEERARQQQNGEENEDAQEEEEKYDFKAKIREANETMRKCRTQVVRTKSKISSALSLIGSLERQQGKVDTAVGDYQTMVEKKKEKVSAEEYEILQNTESQMASNRQVIANAISMKGQLQQNKAILENLDGVLSQQVEENLESYESKKQAMQQQIAALGGYRISNLKFSYGSLSGRSQVENPVKRISQISGSLLDLVLDEDKELSDKSLDNPDYYYQKYKGESEENPRVDISGDIADENISNTFGTVSKVFGGEKKLEEIGKDASDTLLYQAYIKKQFDSYVTKTNRFSQMPLDYEQEYILCGEASDKKNIEHVVNRILLIRTVINFSYLLSDQTKMEKAHATAVLLAGFTGIHAIVRVTQFAILTAWAYEESIIDAAVLMKGEKVPLLKNANTFAMSYGDVLAFSKALVKEKVAEQSGDDQGIGYEDYLNLFLLFQKKTEKVYRTMDLIEENLQLRESELFSFEHCIYGLEATCNYGVPAKFAALDFMKGFGYADQSWNFSFKQTYSY